MIREMKETFSKIMWKFCQTGEVYYINGAETLPPPLSPEEECDILTKFEDDRSYADILISRNLRLVVYIAKKFDGCGTGIEDLISIGTIGLIKAIDSFDADKGIRFATYAARCIENEVLMFFRSKRRTPALFR